MTFAGPPAFGALLAGAWLLLPAIQYAGAYLRTQATIGEAASPGSLGAIDLSPCYVVLLGLTVLYVALSALSRRTGAQAAARSSPE